MNVGNFFLTSPAASSLPSTKVHLGILKEHINICAVIDACCMPFRQRVVRNCAAASKEISRRVRKLDTHWLSRISSPLAVCLLTSNAQRREYLDFSPRKMHVGREEKLV